jgi:NADH:ubiquinone oxidoreductase subunit H
LILLLNISFLTIYEQYLIGLSQNRLGPNINSFLGFFQAIFDGIKLLKKESLLLFKINFVSFFFSFCIFLISFYF